MCGRGLWWCGVSFPATLKVVLVCVLEGCAGLLCTAGVAGAAGVGSLRAGLRRRADSACSSSER